MSGTSCFGKTTAATAIVEPGTPEVVTKLVDKRKSLLACLIFAEKMTIVTAQAGIVVQRELDSTRPSAHLQLILKSILSMAGRNSLGSAEG